MTSPLSIDAGPTVGLGCMRLSTLPDRDEEVGVAVIHAALDAGATLLDTADAYCHDERDVGHNERLVARALASWSGDRSKILAATKSGIRRPKGAWVADGRAKHLRDACDASRRALGVDVIDLYQLHAVDPKTPFETSVRALASLQRDGAIRRVGLCNVTVGQIEAARAIVEIGAVQVSLSPFDDENLRNGVAEYCRDHEIPLIAYRPLGGERATKLARDPLLSVIAQKYEATAQEIVLAWLAGFRGVIPIPGATRVETARSLERVRALTLAVEDAQALDDRFCRASPSRPTKCTAAECRRERRRGARHGNAGRGKVDICAASRWIRAADSRRTRRRTRGSDPAPRCGAFEWEA